MPEDTLGRPLGDLRISVTDRCNFRCPYCMPADRYGERYRFLPRDQILSFEEIARLADLMARLGVGKVRLTGGEPLLREGLEALVAQVARIERIRDLTLTTNGYLLAGRARPLRQAGLRRVTVSLDSLDREVFRKLVGRGHFPEKVLEGIRAAEQAGLSPIKINTVVIRGVNEASILGLARLFRGTGHTVRFIEYMDVGNLNGWSRQQVVPAAEILARIDAVHPLEPVAPEYPGEVARRYRYCDGAGEIGVVASITAPFCGDCTRARLSTDGRLYTCLFATGGTDLKGPMRAGATDGELVRLLERVWGRREDRYSERRAELEGRLSGKVEMHRIGG